MYLFRILRIQFFDSSYHCMPHIGIYYERISHLHMSQAENQCIMLIVT